MKARLGDIELSPDVFSVVMATGILSIAARNHRYWRIGNTLGVAASLGLAVLVVLVVATLAAKRRIDSWELTDPDVTLRLFTFVAACAVLDTRLSSHLAAVRILGAVALSAWLVLVVLTVRNMSARGWVALRDHAHGAWELASVGSSGLAIVMAQVASHNGHRWWLLVAGVIWLLAIGIYGVMTWLILWRAVAERREHNGFEPDSWILMGALAIATLAGDNIHQVAPDWAASGVRTATVITWVTATLWIPPLIYFGLHHISRRPEVLQFHGVWWALVFPLGMYSVATWASARELHLRWMQTVSLVFFWNALAAWLIVAVAGLLLSWRRLADKAGS